MSAAALQPNAYNVYLRLPEVIRRTGLKKTAIYSLIKRGQFPSQIKLGRISVWLEHDINALQRQHQTQARMSA